MARIKTVPKGFVQFRLTCHPRSFQERQGHKRQQDHDSKYAKHRLPWVMLQQKLGGGCAEHLASRARHRGNVQSKASLFRLASPPHDGEDHAKAGAPQCQTPESPRVA